MIGRDDPGSVGLKLRSALANIGHKAISNEDFEILSIIRDRYEILVSAVHVMTSFSDPDTRIYAKKTLDRLYGPDRSTPFEDLRMQVAHLTKDNSELRESLIAVLATMPNSKVAEAAEKAKACLERIG